MSELSESEHLDQVFSDAARAMVPEGAVLDAYVIVVSFIGPDGEDYYKVFTTPGVRAANAVGLMHAGANLYLNGPEDAD